MVEYGLMRLDGKGAGGGWQALDWTVV